MGLSRNYHHFAKVIAMGPATGHPETIAMVMKLSGGSADPDEVSDWWHQWITLRDAMKAFYEQKKTEATVKVMAQEVAKVERQAAMDAVFPKPEQLPPLSLPIFNQVQPPARPADDA
jgi:hypothetical protein